MKEMVDRLGELRDTIKALKQEEESILGSFKDIDVGTTIFGERYKLQVKELMQTELNPHSVRQFLNDDTKFMSIVTITKKDAARVLLPPDIERLSDLVGLVKRFTTQRITKV